MRAEDSRASNRAMAPRLPGRRSVAVASLLMPVACVASCTVWPAVAGDGGTRGHAAADERLPEAGAAGQEPALEAEAGPPQAPACASDPQCAAPTRYCVAGVCASTKALGSACSAISIPHRQRLHDGALLAASPYVDWASLLRRTFEVDVLACTHCGGRLRVLSVITEPGPVRRILEHLGMPADPVPIARARDRRRSWIVNLQYARWLRAIPTDRAHGDAELPAIRCPFDHGGAYRIRVAQAENVLLLRHLRGNVKYSK